MTMRTSKARRAFTLIEVLLVIVILRLVGALMGAVAANRGELYRYPMTFRLLR